MTTSYDAIDAAEEATSTGPESDTAPSHGMTFVTLDGSRELARMDVAGLLPIPRFGDRVGLHGHMASVLVVSTNYGRDGDTGQVVVNMLVRILAEGDTSPYQSPLAKPPGCFRTGGEGASRQRVASHSPERWET